MRPVRLKRAADRRGDRIERSTRLGAIGTAGLRHVGLAAAALAAERFGRLAHQIDREKRVVRSA